MAVTASTEVERTRPGDARRLPGAEHALAWGRWLGSIGLISATILFFASIITFLVRAASGLTPISLVLRGNEANGGEIDPEAVARVLHEWGLDQPLIVQYFNWAGAALTGDLGKSWIDQRSVTDTLLTKLPVSLSVTVLAVLIAIVFGALFGIVAAVLQGSFIDRALTWVSSVFTAVPSFVIAVLLIIVFSVELRWLPSGGYVPPDKDLGLWLKHITLPAIALSLGGIADIARQLRNGIVTARQGNYATGALLRGLSPTRILFVHVLRNGVGPALTVLGMLFPFILGSSILIEQIFALPGYGSYTTEYASFGDVPVVQGALIVSVVLVLIFNLLVNAALNRLSPSAKRGI